MRTTGAIVVLILLAATAGGCSVGVPAGAAGSLESLSAAARDGLHVRLVNSPIDPVRLGRLDALARGLRRTGVEDIKFVAIGNGGALAEETRSLRSQDPDARIVLVGWSGASLAVWDAATQLEAEGMRLDGVVYLDSNWIKKRVTARGHPGNIDRILLVYRENNPPPDGIDGAAVVRVPTRNHLAVPGHPDTVAALAEFLTVVAGD